MASIEERLIVLDVFDCPSDDAFRAVRGGPSPEATVYRLSADLPKGEPVPYSTSQPVPFELLQTATHHLVERARGERAADVRWFVAGRAPLPLFAQLGFELSAWAGSVTHLNQRKEGEWDVVRVGDTAPPPAPFFAPAPARTPSDADGRVAIFVSTMGNELPERAIRSYLKGHDEPLAGIVQLRTMQQTWLTAENAPRAAHELAQALSAVAAQFPHSLERGVALFVAGSATLAFLAGRAANPRIVREVWVPNHRSGDYEDGVFLPAASPSRPLDTSEAAQEARVAVLQAVQVELEFLKGNLRAEHVAASRFGPPATTFLEALRGLDLAPQPESESSGLAVPRERRSDGFALKPSRGSLSLGEGLCEALRGKPEATIRGISAQLIVHELFHGFQSLTYGNYREIGRAGVVLESIDYEADVFAVRALARLRAEESNVSLPDALREEIRRLIGGIETFDRAEQGPRIDRLSERRLRRYLIWWLQLARAQRVQANCDVDRLFAARLTAELAPVPGRLDHRHDKIVTGHRSDTALLLSVDGRFRRIDPGPNLAPGSLIDCIREFQGEALNEAMERVVEAHLDVLVPWVA